MDLIFKNKDGKDFFHRFDIDHTPRLRRMNVLQASSFEAVCDPVKRELEQPALKVAFSVFHTMRVEDNDQLTARDLALFYLMIAKIDPREYYSKEVEIGDERKIIRFLDREYSFPIALAASYLGERKDRLPRAVQALNSTLVSFDFRWGYAGPRRMKHPLMKCGIRGNDIAFTVPGFLIKQIALSRSYATVELNALARFKSKYTPRFYPNLARVAGYSFDSARKLAISPEALAKKVGYTWNGKFHLGHFKSRCLGPMLKDLRNRERVKAFDFTMTPDVDENGKSVLVFKPTRMKKTLQQIKSKRLADSVRLEVPGHERSMSTVGQPFAMRVNVWDSQASGSTSFILAVCRSVAIVAHVCSTALATGEETVFSRNCLGPDRAFDDVGVDFDAPIGQEALQGFSAGRSRSGSPRRFWTSRRLLESSFSHNSKRLATMAADFS